MDIWERWLPHIGYTGGDSDFLYDAAKRRYLFQHDYDSEEEGDLMVVGDEEGEERGREREQNMKEENGLSVISDEGIIINTLDCLRMILISIVLQRIFVSKFNLLSMLQSLYPCSTAGLELFHHSIYNCCVAVE